MQPTTNLRVAEQATKVAVTVYRMTSDFPTDERFGLTAQMRRAAVSVGSNIAEGCGRRGNRELLQFLYIASGSASELAFQLQLACALGLGEEATVDATRTELLSLQRMLNRLTQHLANRPVTRRPPSRG
ncbi:MAG TPA: four helix bundle protein [Gemmatimonadaceae bacterium]